MEEQLIIPMTAEEYLAGREELRRTHGNSHKESAARYDQALADYFLRSGWSQRELAEIERCSQGHIDKQLRFGRFRRHCLNPLWIQAPLLEHINEWKFRACWAKTDKALSENERFEEVKAMIEAESDKPPTPRGKNIMVKRLLAEFGDGEFHAVRVMATKLDVPQEKLLTILEGMRLHGFYHTEGERRRAPVTDGGWRYRLRPHRGHVVPYDTLREELAPLLEELRYQGKQDQYKLAPIVFTNIAHKIEQALEKLAR